MSGPVFDNKPALIGGIAFLSRLTGRTPEAVQWIARRIETLLEQGVATDWQCTLLCYDLKQQPWKW